MSKKDEIITLYFEEKMSAIEISKNIEVGQSYITKVIKQDSRYSEEKQRRKENTRERHNKINRENMRKVRKELAISNDVLKIQHYQASLELSGRKTISNRAFRNWNSSIYRFHEKTKEYRVKEELKEKISYAVPKKIKWK
ncbi:MAG: hypothetical protein IJJ82_07375 [Clostridia bacterium]|nr:hypothetical protein [Clostridia bacterium]